MADEPDNDTPQDLDGAPVEPDAAGEQPEAEGEGAAAPQADVSEAGGDAPLPAPDASGAEQAHGSDAEDAVAEAEGEGAEGGDAPVAPAPVAPAPAGESAEQPSPKERRRKARSRHAGVARPPRSPEERHADRLVERRAKAVRRRARRLKERAKAAERRAQAPAPEPLAPVHAAVEGTRRVRQGIVVSDKAEKTITVRIDVARRHRRYEKIVRSSSTLHAHDENNDAHEGDVVRVIESRPLSRSKRWRLVEVVERAR
jgi:small subunit ribosomal protein S17